MSRKEVYFDAQRNEYVQAPPIQVDEIIEKATQVKQIKTYTVRIIYKVTVDFEKPHVQVNQNVFNNVISVDETDHYLVISFVDNSRRMIKHDDIDSIDISEDANETKNYHD